MQRRLAANNTGEQAAQSELQLTLCIHSACKSEAPNPLPYLIAHSGSVSAQKSDGMANTIGLDGINGGILQDFKNAVRIKAKIEKVAVIPISEHFLQVVPHSRPILR